MIILMKEILLRDRAAFFWLVLFPSILFFTFHIIFSSFGSETNFSVGASVPYFYQIPMKQIFDLKTNLTEKEIIEKVKKDALAAGVIFKNRKFFIYHTNSTDSLVAADILKSVLSTFGTRERKISVEFQMPKKERKDSYFFVIAVTMAILVVGFFGAIYTEEHLRRHGLKKLFKILPNRKLKIDFMIFLVHITILLISLGVAIGTAFVLSEKIFYKNLVKAVIFGIPAFIPLGMGLGKIFKKSAELVANVLYFTTLFLSGAFFDFKVPFNPATTIVEIYKKGHTNPICILWIALSLIIYWLGVKIDERAT